MTKKRAILWVCGFALLLVASCSSGRDSLPRLAAPLPFGTVDPVNAARDDGTLQVTGWVLSDDGVQTVALYVDGRYVTSARMNQPRPDVNQAYPAYGQARAGWIIDFDTRLFVGDRELVVQARTVNDAVRQLGAWRMRFGGRP